jgi:hypothetical protein
MLLTTVSARVLVPSVFCFLRQQHKVVRQHKFALMSRRVSVIGPNRGACFCSPSTPTLVLLSACYARDGAKIGRLTLVNLFWLPYSAAASTSLTVENPFWPPFYSASVQHTLALEKPILAPSPTPASSTRQRHRNASVREANSGSLSNTSVSDTLAQSIRQRNENTSV